MNLDIVEKIKTKGDVEAIIEYIDGRPSEFLNFHNIILRKGRQALAASVANEIGDSYDFYISRMLFGSSGTSGGTPKYVDDSRNGLFGSITVNKPVVSIIDSGALDQVIFTSVITFDEGNGTDINEMALQMNTGNLFSMVTFGGISKSNIMQITWKWRLSFI